MKTIKVKFDISWNGFTDSDTENLWCSIDENTSQIILDNIPVYKTDVSYQDEIAVKIQNDQIWFDKVLHKSGNKTLQLYLSEDEEKKVKEWTFEYFATIGATFEGMNWYLFWVNIPRSVDLRDVSEKLDEHLKFSYYEIIDPREET